MKMMMIAVTIQMMALLTSIMKVLIAQLCLGKRQFPALLPIMYVLALLHCNQISRVNLDVGMSW